MTTGYNKGDHDLWRVKNSETLDIAFIGNTKGAGLVKTSPNHIYQGPHTYRWSPADSKVSYSHINLI